MKEFLSQNWEKVIIVAVAVLSFIASLIITIKKKGSNNIIDSIKEAVLENLPFWCVLSEGLNGGESKRDNVLSLGIALVSKMLGRNLTADENDYFVAFISEHLEKILATPQKKLEAPKKADSSRYRAN